VEITISQKPTKFEAELGGMCEYDQLELARQIVNRRLEKVSEFAEAFAVWRVEAPWLPRPRRPKGSKMGGGKGKAHHFVTPVRQGRVILELGGRIVEDQVGFGGFCMVFTVFVTFYRFLWFLRCFCDFYCVFVCSIECFIVWRKKIQKNIDSSKPVFKLKTGFIANLAYFDV